MERLPHFYIKNCTELSFSAKMYLKSLFIILYNANKGMKRKYLFFVTGVI